MIFYGLRAAFVCRSAELFVLILQVLFEWHFSLPA